MNEQNDATTGQKKKLLSRARLELAALGFPTHAEQS
jgi:hypothetical protein